MSRKASKRVPRPRFRLRTKLAIWLIVAGMLPLLVVSAFSLRTTTQRLQESILNSTRTSLQIAVNLLLSQIQTTLTDASRLAASPQIAELLKERSVDSEHAKTVLERFRGQVVSGLVEIFDDKGRPIVRYSLSEPNLVRLLATPEKSDLLARGLDLERDVDLARTESFVSIKAVAPVLDQDFRRLGAVVLTLPMDYHMAEQLRAVLGVDVLFYRLTDKGTFEPSACSILGPRGGRFAGIRLGSHMQRTLQESTNPRFVVEDAFGVSYSLGILPLVAASDGTHRHVVGLLAVAVDRGSVVRSRNDAIRALALMALGLLAVAMAVAVLAARSLSKPLGRLHQGAIQVARGNLELTLPVMSSDEIGALAEAFNYMTASLRENRRRLAARVSEMVALHSLSRAVNSGTTLDEILRTVVAEVRKALGADKIALYLADPDEKLWLAASSGLSQEEMDRWERDGASPVAQQAAQERDPVWTRDVASDDSDLARAAREQGIQEGSVLAVPFRHKSELVAVLVVARGKGRPAFGQPEARLLGLFSEQAGTAIVNARLNEELRLFNEKLEQLVQQRTAELQRANKELAAALDDLRKTQAQLVLSERLAGMGTLVAGIAHEVNTPATAIQGACDNLKLRFSRINKVMEALMSRPISRPQWELLVEILSDVLSADTLPANGESTGELASVLEARGVPNAEYLASRLEELGLREPAERIVQSCPEEEHLSLEALLTALAEIGALKTNLLAISASIERITRVVSALRSYSHMDPDMVQVSDIHEGIETTLVILANRLKYNITVVRNYSDLPPVPVYVDELNQVWTNLIANAADAILEGPGKGTITIETSLEDGYAVVRIADDGPGIPKELLPRIFEPFFTTKPKGKGTGLGLGIVAQIVEKHGGRIQAESEPGRTVFSVYLPIDGPPEWRASRNQAASRQASRADEGDEAP